MKLKHYKLRKKFLVELKRHNSNLINPCTGILRISDADEEITFMIILFNSTYKRNNIVREVDKNMKNGHPVTYIHIKELDRYFSITKRDRNIYQFSSYGYFNYTYNSSLDRLVISSHTYNVTVTLDMRKDET